VRCYSPAQIRAAYRIQPVLDAGITGKGRTIVIVDAFQSPTIRHDLADFDALFNVPDPTLNIIAPDGLTPFDPTDQNQVGWAGEISLDVQWAHAVAPGAVIDLVLAKSNDDKDILSATRFAVKHNLGDVISQSFGEGETCSAMSLAAKHRVFASATRKGITLIASAGDWGAAQLTCDGSSYFLSTWTPASDPLVTAVGGTHLEADARTGAYLSETEWNDAFGAGGGGFSTVFGKPFYQYGTPGIGAYRGVPDVAYNGDVNGGVLAVASSLGAGTNAVFSFGGTSAGAPQWAGIVALGAQRAHHRLGLINVGLYLLGHSSFYHRAFHDVRTGNNTITTTDSTGNPVTVLGYAAKRGWDPVTGWGTPKVSALLPLLTPLTIGPNYQDRVQKAIAVSAQAVEKPVPKHHAMQP
jgi:subtilase family serine protease